MSEPRRYRAEGQTPDDGPLLDVLRRLIGEEGQSRAAELLEVSERTLQRTLASGRLTVHMRDTLRLHLVSTAHRRALAHIRVLEERVETLTAELREAGAGTAEQPASAAPLLSQAPGAARTPAPPEAVAPRARTTGGGADAAAASTPPVQDAEAVVGRPKHVITPRRAHPDLVTLEPEEGEDFVYGNATPLIVEWRGARACFMDRRNSRVERAACWVRMCELASTLIEKYELTLPLADYPWDQFERRRELQRSGQSLRDARRELRRARCWRFLRRVLTLGACRT